MVFKKIGVNNRVVSLCLMNGVCMRVSSRVGGAKWTTFLVFLNCKKIAHNIQDLSSSFELTI